jgi:hypothetical protein
MTGERQPIAFTEDAFKDIYRIHIKTLEDTRANAPIAMHKVLHQLFRDVTSVPFCTLLLVLHANILCALQNIDQSSPDDGRKLCDPHQPG